MFRHKDQAKDQPKDQPKDQAKGHGKNLPEDQWEKVTGNVVDLQMMPKLTGPGMDFWPHPKKYVVQLHPEGHEPYSAEVIIPPVDYPEDFFFASPGAVTGFIVNPATGEVRFDMSDPRNSTEAHLAEGDRLVEELLSGHAASRGEVVTGPPWVVPALCPGCGAPVDQATASMEIDPKCTFCEKPLPVEPRGQF